MMLDGTSGVDLCRRQAEDFFGPGRITRHQVEPRAKGRPHCVHCDQPFGQRAYRYVTSRYQVGSHIPQHNRRDGYLVEERVIVGASMGPGGTPGATVYRTLWDGRSYVSKSRINASPFCTMTCAVRFAQKAYQDGYRLKSVSNSEPSHIDRKLDDDQR